MDLDRWVNDNNPDEQLQYGKGWWDYIELIRRLMYKFGAEEAHVVATYPMRTPPPEEDLLMPVVQFEVGSTEFIVKYDFGVYPERWMVSVKNAISIVRPILVQHSSAPTDHLLGVVLPPDTGRIAPPCDKGWGNLNESEQGTLGEGRLHPHCREYARKWRGACR